VSRYDEQDRLGGIVLCSLDEASQQIDELIAIDEAGLRDQERGRRRLAG
jgi:hypothetical protein